MGECVFDVVLSDLRLPDRDGITLLEWIRHKSPHSEVIIMTGYANVSTAVAAIKLGAFDYLEKPVNPEILREKMTAAVTRHEQRRSRPETQSASEPGTAIVWGHSEASAKLRDHLLLVAPTNMSVLITGESGTGKEYAARFIHANSKRKARPFVAVDCGVLSRELAASEPVRTCQRSPLRRPFRTKRASSRRRKAEPFSSTRSATCLTTYRYNCSARFRNA